MMLRVPSQSERERSWSARNLVLNKSNPMVVWKGG